MSPTRRQRGEGSEHWCDCPSGLGFRFHRHPCALAGVIDGPREEEGDA